MSDYKWIVAVGDVFHAVDLYGVFEHHEDAEEWARTNAREKWGVHAVKQIGEK